MFIFVLLMIVIEIVIWMYFLMMCLMYVGLIDVIVILLVSGGSGVVRVMR